MKQHKNTIQTIKNTVNASTHITNTPTHYKTHTHTHPHVTKQVKTTIEQDTPKWNSHNIIKYAQYKVTLLYMVRGGARGKKPPYIPTGTSVLLSLLGPVRNPALINLSRRHKKTVFIRWLGYNWEKSRTEAEYMLTIYSHVQNMIRTKAKLYMRICSQCCHAVIHKA
jgi:hypothetical protein